MARGADVIGMAGGDGSQALVASVASRHGLPFVVVPAGTRNHFALDLGIDREDVRRGARRLRRRGRAGHRPGRGERTRVREQRLHGCVREDRAVAEYRDAKMQTAAELLPDLLGPNAQPLDLRFELPSGERRPRRSSSSSRTTPISSVACAGTRPGPLRWWPPRAGLAAGAGCGGRARSWRLCRPSGRSGGSRDSMSGRLLSSRSGRRARWRSGSTVRPSDGALRQSSGPVPGIRLPRRHSRCPAATVVHGAVTSTMPVLRCHITSRDTLAGVWRRHGLGRPVTP